ncbi:hypothetical protein [Shinella zoogloeoides]|uniref:hypothetical protein n=1 Tax=Shinella zoogloeoides TaxID=352475 RepID=UPI0027400D8C|nr:hypothetical protein [Shinella zoogloeoides]WLR91036.1 hypothetical protein Q9316_00375 [Shinella zoogloeoides]
MNNTSKNIIALAQEDAEATADLLSNIQKTDGGSVTIYQGEHPEYGNIFVVIPAFGQSYLLTPFEVLSS